MSDSGVTRAESCVIACAEAWRGAGEVMASPFGTIPSLGARLAKLTFAPDLAPQEGGAGVDGPSIFTALQEQLGLRLDSQKGPVEILVIDSVQKASGN